MKYCLTLAIATAVATTAIAQQPYQAINLGFMDNTVRPQDDFYNYVNGNWMKTVQIPSDKARWGSFDELRENTDVAVLEILKTALNETHATGSDGQKIADLYKSYVDFEARNKIGLQPIRKQLADINAIKNLKDLTAYFSKYGR